MATDLTKKIDRVLPDGWIMRVEPAGISFREPGKKKWSALLPFQKARSMAMKIGAESIMQEREQGRVLRKKIKRGLHF